MKRQNIQKAYQRIRPDEEARSRMLNNILLSSEIPPAGKDERKMRRKMKPMVIAAIIALMVMLMGCAIVALSLQDMKIGDRITGYGEILDSDGNIIKKTDLISDVISLQGIQNTPAYLANQEWFQFMESYTPEAGEYWESDEAYWAYNVLNQTMVDKIDEICEKHGLKVIGKPWHEHVDCYQFLPLVGIEDILKADSNAELHIPRGRFFEGGSFTVYGTLTMPEWDAPLYLTYHCVQKDVFYDVFAYIPQGIATEKNYTTEDNEELLLVESARSGLIMMDSDNCFITISIDLNQSVSLEQIAEQFDFTIQPNSMDTNRADEREQQSIELVSGNGGDPNYLHRSTYREYVNDLLWNDHLLGQDGTACAKKEYAYHDLDGNGEEELLIIRDGFISNVVGMKDGKTDEGKSYCMVLCEGNVLIDKMEIAGNIYYHVFTFANDGDPAFSNQKEQSIVRLKCENGEWWRTSSTEHYADYDVQITEEEAMEILNAYTAVELDVNPLEQFAE